MITSTTTMGSASVSFVISAKDAKFEAALDQSIRAMLNDVLLRVASASLQEAIAICGTQTELARRIGGKVKTGHIYHWLRNRVPPERCADIERATEGRVTRHDLRPDVFGAAPASLQEAG